MKPVLLLLLLAALAPLPSPGQDAAALPAEPVARWYKVNLHTHTLWSDGNDFPEMVADWYRSHGYHVLALSDHNTLSRGEKWIAVREIEKRGGRGALEKYRQRFGATWVETRGEDAAVEVRLKPLDEVRALVEESGRFLMIQSEEITDQHQDLPIHINATNLAELIEPRGGTSVRDTIERNFIAVEEQATRLGRSILPHLNHPNFGWAITAEDLAAVARERFFEVYNGHPGVHHGGDDDHPSVERMWDIANTIRVASMAQPPLFGLATDDAHHYHGRDAKNYSRMGRGWVMVRALRLTPETIIAALRAGDFYASSGVTLREIAYDAATSELRVEIEPAGEETFVTEFIGTLEDHDPDSEPRTDARGREITRRYSRDVGRRLARVEGLRAAYRLTGRELWVRAVVTSTARPDDASFAGQRRQAWTQPVGWEERVAR